MRECPVCGSYFPETLFTQAYVLPKNFPLLSHSKEELYSPIVKCKNCGGCYSDVSYNNSMLTQYYERFAQHSSVSAFSMATPNQFYSDVLSKCSRLLKTNSRILDIGSGNGELLHQLSAIGRFELSALDISTAYKTEFENRGIQFIEKNMCSPSSLDVKSYDNVFIVSVLEHIRDVSSFLSSLVELVSIGSSVFVSVPDLTYYAEELEHTIQQINLEHINHFDLNSLRILFSRYGFTLSEHWHVKAKVGNLCSSQLLACFEYTGNHIPQVKSEITSADHSDLKELENNYINSINPELVELVAAQTPVAVVGVGNYTFSQLAVTQLSKCHIQFFVDGNINKQNCTLIGKPVLSYQALVDFEGVVIVSNAFDPKVMISMIKKSNSKLKVIVL